MSRRTQSIVLAGLVTLLLVVAYINLSPSRSILGDTAPSEKVALLKVENPSLHMDQLERIRKEEGYTGTHRNVFSASLPPPPEPTAAERAKTQPIVGPQQPPPPPPLTVPLSFYGLVIDAHGHRRAFFSKEDDVYIAAEGETLLSNYRLLHITNNTVELEEISSGRRATLTLEQQPQAGAAIVQPIPPRS